MMGVPEHLVSDRDLAGLWTEADHDASGEIEVQDFQRVAYELELSAWPDLLARNHEQRLARVVKTLNDAADKWHRAGGNWFKVFKALDTDDSGKMGYEELLEVLRKSRGARV